MSEDRTGRKELVRKAVKMQNPERIPLLYACTLEKSDVVNVEAVRHFGGHDGNMSEWGFEWCNIDKSLAMGKPKEHLLGTWDGLLRFKAPDPFDKSRFEKIRDARARYGEDRYFKANFVLSGFTVMTLLRGFNEMMEDLYLERDKVEELADIVFGFEEEIIRQAKDHGYDAIGLADDWGTQENLMISPALWRDIFKPRYKKQIKLAHEHGLDVYLHSCGYIYDIIADLVEIGLDILNTGQPGLNGIARMGAEFGGKICFSCPVSYQTTGVTGTREEIFDEVRQLVRHLGSKGGGLIGAIPEDSKGLGITQEKLDWMVEAFTMYGKYK